jgi:pimeloyl-ACP methyl ester carboxylesterase
VRSLLAAICLAPALWAQTGAQLATFRSSADGTEQPYALYVPRGFDAAQRYPLLLSLHSEDTNHRMNLRQAFGLSIRSGEANPEDLRYFPATRDMGFFVVSPFARGTMDYQGVSERDVFDVLAEVRKRFPIDPDRIYLTGVSMGGAAALRFALTRPDLWAAVAPVCPAPLSGLDDLAVNASNLPIRIFQGDADPISPVANARLWQRRLVDAGVNAEYVEYPGVRHNAWDLAYRSGALFEWFDKHRRNAAPEGVRIATRSYRDASAYWVRIDGLTPGTLATLDARRTGADVSVKAANVDGFTLNLDRAGVVTIDGAPLRMRAGAALSFSKAAGKWRAAKFAPAGKRLGLEGPIVEAVRGRPIYVYGTVGATGEAVETRKKVAEGAAEWTGARGARPVLHFPVRADNTITPEEVENSDLVLFGTRETNSLIARLAPQLPMSLNPGAADYGLLFIAPAGNHYVLVSSGLPWWTGAEEANRGGPAFASEQFRLLSTFGDYILFKGSLANVVAEGRFDTNWKVPAADAAKLAASGTVTVQ